MNDERCLAFLAGLLTLPLAASPGLSQTELPDEQVLHDFVRRGAETAQRHAVELLFKLGVRRGRHTDREQGGEDGAAKR